MSYLLQIAPHVALASTLAPARTSAFKNRHGLLR
jgi:hypothetical protein